MLGFGPIAAGPIAGPGGASVTVTAAPDQPPVAAASRLLRAQANYRPPWQPIKRVTPATWLDQPLPAAVRGTITKANAYAVLSMDRPFVTKAVAYAVLDPRVAPALPRPRAQFWPATQRPPPFTTAQRRAAFAYRTAPLVLPAAAAIAPRWHAYQRHPAFLVRPKPVAFVPEEQIQVQVFFMV